MIFFDGGSGSLGRYFRAAAETHGTAVCELKARLEDQPAFLADLRRAASEGTEPWAVLVQLAAIVPVAQCERSPEAAYQTNVVSAVERATAFCDYVASIGRRPALVYVSTGHVYSAAPDGYRIPESHPLMPRSQYARTKAEAEARLTELARKRGVALTVARGFGVIAPEQREGYILPSLIQRAIKRDLQSVPGLDNVRDYLDARDVCRALATLAVSHREAKGGIVGPVNVCSGEPLSIRGLLHEVLHAIYGEDIPAVSKAEGRPDDIPWMVGDPARLTRILGGSPRRVPLTETVRAAVAAQP